MKNVTEPKQNCNEFGERLENAITNKFKSIRQFSLASAIPPSSLMQYLKGISEPTRPVLCIIANTLDVDLNWLITGKGDPSGAAVIAPLDMEALQAAIALTEEAAENVGAKLTPEKKASIASMIYEDIADSPADQESSVDMTNVVRLVKLAV